MAVHATKGIVTCLFSDIEGSTRLWETEPQRMSAALARHDALTRATVERHRGTVVKSSGDGVHAAFDDPFDGVGAAHELVVMLAEAATPGGVPLNVRCGLHTGVAEKRDGDYFGTAVNRAARIMAAAHGGQILLSQAVVDLVRDRLPPAQSVLDLGFVRLRDLTSPEHVYQLAAPGLRSEFPALRSLESTPNNLPQQLTTFIGRTRELAEVLRLLTGARLLTLLGTGGIGKTRLSLQVAADAMDGYPDGTWFVDLAAVTDPLLVPQAVARALGVQEQAGAPLMQTLCNHLKSRMVLLVLDNCEHLLSACGAFAKALLQAARVARVIASSREPLQVAGEQTYAVRPLSLPHAGDDAESLLRSEAVQLFVERARMRQPAFALTDRLAPAVMRICSRLDGIPLALELAAARVGTLGVETIAQRLDDRFRLLAGGARDVQPRQQTLRAMIDWSFDLLDASERTLFARLSVFAGGCTLEAAEAVCAGGEIAQHDVLDLLGSLTAKSLVNLAEDGGRYHMLETIGVYARDRLEERGESTVVRDRHRDYFLGIAEDAAPELAGGPGQSIRLARLEIEHDNLRAALAWSLAGTGTDEAARICGALYLFWIHHGHYREGRGWCDAAVARGAGRMGDSVHAKALLGAGSLAIRLGDAAAARASLEQALALCRAAGDRALEARVLNNLATAAFDDRDFVSAQSLFDQAVVINRELGNEIREVICLVNLANAACSLGDFAGATAPLARAIALSRALGLRTLESDALGHMAIQACHDGDYATARALGEEAVAIDRELGVRSHEAQKLLRLGQIAIAARDFTTARARLAEALTTDVALESVPGTADDFDDIANLATELGMDSLSARFAGAADALRGATGSAPLPVDLARCARYRGQTREALGDAGFDAAFAAGRAIPADDAVAEALRFLRGGDSEADR
jgi:predicted ATPase/class 3 adenylate cyclase